jgi:uncharacterized protein
MLSGAGSPQQNRNRDGSRLRLTEPISVIIPALNEVSVLATTLESIRPARPLEVILVDGGSLDGTLKLAKQHGATILFSTPGRARQMNLGAAAASGSILLFLHSDTRPPLHFDKEIRNVISGSAVVAGAFELSIDAQNPSLRWIERMANWRSRTLHMPYGDQAIFVRAEVFRAIGGFSELPIMEDFELMLRLRRLGRIAIIPQPALTSARRWHETGILKTTLINQIAILSYFLGISPSRIARWYHGRNNQVGAKRS